MLTTIHIHIQGASIVFSSTPATHIIPTTHTTIQSFSARRHLLL